MTVYVVRDSFTLSLRSIYNHLKKHTPNPSPLRLRSGLAPGKCYVGASTDASCLGTTKASGRVLKYQYRRRGLCSNLH